MIILAVAASALLTLIFIVRKRQLEVRGGKRLAYHFFDKSLEFLIPLTIIGSLFLLLSLFVAGTSDKTTIQRLLFFEHLVNVFKWFVSIFKVGALIAAGLLIIFYLLTLTRIPSKHTSRLLPFFKKYQKTVKRVYMVAIILFSFTFFGTQAGEPWAKLRFRINEADKEFAGLRHEVEDAVSQEVAKKLLEKVRDSLPQDYRDDVSEQDQYFLLFSNLRSEYQVFKTNYETRDPDAEILLNTTRPPDPPPSPPGQSGGQPKGGGTGPYKSLDKGSVTKPERGGGKSPNASFTEERIVYDLFEEGERTLPSSEPAPQEVSAEKIRVAKESVKNYRERIQAQAVKIIQSEHGRELAIQLPTSLTGKVREVVFKALTDRYPILEPFVGVFFGTLNKELEVRTGKAIDNVTRSVAVNPDRAQRIIEEQASKVVGETHVSTPSLMLRKVREVGQDVRKRTQSIRNAIAQLKGQANKFDTEARTVLDLEKQIELLSCNNEQLRKEAAAKLASASPSLSSNQVARVEALLQNNEIRLRKSVKYPHLYEEVPVQYYAALAVQNMQSGHLTEGVKETASEIIGEVTRTPLKQRTYYDADKVEASGLAAP